jgi:hypothetical protein
MRKPNLEFPVRIALTDKGVRFFLHNRRKISQVRLSDGALESGLVMQPVNAQALQGMICRAYVSTVEVARSEFRTRRNELIDLNKLIVYALLYERFANHIHRFLLSSDFVDRWNREHPRHPIDARSRFSELPVDQFLRKHETLQGRVAGVIMSHMEAGLRDQQGNDLDGAEKDTRLNIGRRFLSHLHHSTWFLLLESSGTDHNDRLLEKIGKLLVKFVRKVDVADCLSFIIMEMAAYEESAKLQVTARRLFRATECLDLEDDEIMRSQVRTHLESHKDFLYLTWRIRHGDLPHAVRPALQVDLINKCYDFHSLKAQMDSRKRIDVRERSLADFYEKLPESHTDGDFGQYYLSYLEQACTDLRMPFESRVSHLGPENLTVISLTLDMKEKAPGAKV